MKRDKIYADSKSDSEAFSFNEEVVDVFEDMISRSVPSYRSNLAELVELALSFHQTGTKIYDLGCSLGAFLIPVAKRLGTQPGDVVVGIDNSSAMINKLLAQVEQLPVELQLADIESTHLSHASVVVLNYTLQFVPVAARSGLLQRIFDALVDDGILLLSEKIIDPDPATNELFIQRHHAFKRSNGYSDLEIHQKRQALEDVLVAETIETHRTRLSQIGFRNFAVWQQHFNFVSMYARK